MSSERTRVYARLTVVCPYCGFGLHVSERDIRALSVSTSVDDVTRIDVELLARHRCAA